MTLRAVILGFLGALVISAVGYLNDSYIQANFIINNHLPIVVFGPLILGMMTANPLLARLRPSWRFKGSELAVIVALLLVGCGIPLGTVGNITDAVVQPVQFNLTRPGWQKAGLISYTPGAMLISDGRYTDAVDDFMGGLGKPDKPIGPADIPWSQWQTPLSVWGPLVLLTGLCAICLSLVVHRQWVSHERLRYPIAEFASSLLEQEGSRGFTPIFRKKLFWIGFGIVLSIHLVNGINTWMNNQFISIPLTFDFPAVTQKFTELGKIPGAKRFTMLILYPTVIAFSYFLASDVSFSLGVCQATQVLLLGILMTAGVTVANTDERGGVASWLNFGGAMALAVVLGYTGRRYYWQVLRRAVTFRAGDELEGSAVWACRVLLLGMAGLVAILMSLGLAWPFAIASVLLIMLLFLVISRLNAESGVFFYKFMWFPSTVLLATCGYKALGPEQMIITGLLAVVLLYSSSQILIPYLITGLKMCDKAEVKPRTMAWPIMATFVVGATVAVVCMLWSNYNYGIPKEKDYGKEIRNMYSVPEKAVTALTLSGDLELSLHSTPLQRLINIQPEKTFLWAGGTAFVLALVFYAARLRFTWWLLHPVLFLGMGVWPVEKLAQSFFIGWFIKRAVLKFGGGKTYRNVVPLMVGVIAGDLLGGFIFMVASWVYYAATGQIPPQYNIMR